jgi:hypothetical protein
VQVRLDRRGNPVSVLLGRRTHPIRQIRDRWRVDDDWWREPLSRMYFELELTDGRIMTLYHDRIQNQWYQQRYG